MTVAEGPIGPGVARDRLAELRGLKGRTRSARRGYWLPLLIFGAVIMAATPLYFRPSQTSLMGLPASTVFKPRPASVVLPPARPGEASQCDQHGCVVMPTCAVVDGVVYTPCFTSFTRGSSSFAGFAPMGMAAASTQTITAYWVVALFVAYLLSAWWYLARGRRRGVSTSPVAFLLVGAGLLALMASSVLAGFDLSALASRLLVGNLRGTQGLEPLYPVAAGFLVLSYLERSRALAAFSVAFGAVAVLVNTGDLESPAGRVGLDVGPEVGVFLAGAFMFAGGLAFTLARWHRA